MTTPETLLIFRIAGIACAVPAESVGSIVMPPAHLTHPPGSNRSTPGIFHHADATYSVIDLLARFGIDAPHSRSGRLLLHHEGIRHFAFLVDEVVGLVRSEEGKWANLPPYLPQNIFWSGFLYRKEIVLCTELGALRTMHDAAPLHRHIEALQQQANTEAPREHRPETPPPLPPAASPTPEKPKSEKAAPQRPQPALDRREPERTAPRQGPPGKKQTSPAPQSPPQPARATPPAAQKPKREPMPAAAPATRKAVPPRPQTTPHTHRPEVETTVQREQTTPYTAQAPGKPTPGENKTESAGFPLLPILLLVTLLSLPLGYWFWLKPGLTPTHRTTPLRVEREVRTPAPVPPKAVTTAPTPPPEATPERPKPEPETKSAAATPPPAEPEERPAKTAEPAAPLTIERDASGTINLIIDREAIARHTQMEPLPLPEQDTSEAEQAKQAGGTPPPSSTEAVTSSENNSVAEASSAPQQEPPLEPEPDWPQPANPTGLEPCDCTHIVVPGDTLWDIAERYTGDAFNYPELARRSGITNPDLIYPGDTVRIIIR